MSEQFFLQANKEGFIEDYQGPVIKTLYVPMTLKEKEIMFFLTLLNARLNLPSVTNSIVSREIDFFQFH